MLASPNLPRSVRDAILAYIIDKLAGRSGMIAFNEGDSQPVCWRHE
jgi:hypothetical protein